MTPVRIGLGQSLAELAAAGYVRYFTMYASELAWYLGNGGQANPKPEGGTQLGALAELAPPFKRESGCSYLCPMPARRPSW